MHTEGWVGVSLNLIKKSVVWLWTWCSLLLQWQMTWYLFWLILSGIWPWFLQLLPTCRCFLCPPTLPPSIYFNIFSHLRFFFCFISLFPTGKKICPYTLSTSWFWRQCLFLVVNHFFLLEGGAADFFCFSSQHLTHSTIWNLTYSSRKWLLLPWKWNPPRTYVAISCIIS